MLQAGPDQPELQALKQSLNEPFFTYRHGKVSVKQFLEWFNPDRIQSHPVLASDFRSALHRAVAFTIRDFLMARKAAVLGYDRLPEVQRQLHLWRNKWVFQEYCDRLLQQSRAGGQGFGWQSNAARTALAASVQDSLPVAPSGAEAERWVQQLKVLADSLRRVYPVRINRAVMDTLNVIRFKKSRWATTLFFKSGTNRLAYPITEPLWGIKPAPSAHNASGP